MATSAFWKNKRVLITGYEGFLGSHLTRGLLNAGARVTGLDIRTHRRETILGASDYRKMTVVKGSVANLSLLRRLAGKKIDIIFHLAAEALVGRCRQRPLRAFEANIKGTWNILEIARENPDIQAVIMASSDKAYGEHKKLPYAETASLKGDHPYDVSKSCADLLAYAYFHTYQVPVGVTRCGNIYGPGDFNFSRLVPDALRCASEGQQLLIRSDGKFSRDYDYVDDIVTGYMRLAENLKKRNLAGEAFNFSDEKPMTVVRLVKKIYEQAGCCPNYKILNEAQDEIKHQYLSSRKARRLLRWKPKVSLEEGLKKTIAWYRGHLTDKKVS